MEIHQKNLTPCVLPFKITKVIGINMGRVTTYNFLHADVRQK